ncbi:MAG: UTP--glucose-1-phosphate uridylyltransferase [Planctomycetota bacterium]|jgi:UDP-N-acetylglucosamine/UDP-N-acetylgalactosamine diphosphorylase
MSVEKSFEDVKKRLEEHNQGHLLTFWGQLDTTGQQELLGQISKLDLAKVDVWAADFVRNPFPLEIPSEFTPAEAYGAQPSDDAQWSKYAEAGKLGKELISGGKVAAFVVAGGQGTRLEFDGPKGNFPISPVKNKTLFQLFAETITAVSKKYGAKCPWYIMTSPLNHEVTKQIFKSNDYYGLNESDVFIFEQGTLPNFDFEGKILLADKSNIACSPDGHGGSLKALYQNGAIEDMKRRGVEFISYFQVDNPLINIFDPLFIGLHALDKGQMSSKALIKTGPKEKLGNFCLVDGKVTVIEYSDIPDKLAEKQNEDGSLVFELGSIAIHIISRGFVEKLNAKAFSLPLHRAVKKIEHVDTDGNFIKPAEPNGIKLESFVFDALPLASKSIILETVRSEEFGPVKNATGVDSAESSQKIMIARGVSWLESAGVAVPRKADGSVDCVIEIAPTFALAKDDIKDKMSRIPQIKPGDKVYLE